MPSAAHKKRFVEEKLESLSKQEKVYKKFRKYLTETYGVEFLDFHEKFVSIRDLDVEHDFDLINSQMNQVCNEFIRDGAKNRFALPSAVRQQINQNVRKKEGDANALQPAYDFIQDDLYEAIYRFLNSSAFKSDSGAANKRFSKKLGGGLRRWLTPTKAPKSLKSSSSSVSKEMVRGASRQHAASHAVLGNERTRRAPRSLPIGLSFNAIDDDDSDDDSSSGFELTFDDDEIANVIMPLQSRARSMLRRRRWWRLVDVLPRHFSCAAQLERLRVIRELVANETKYTAQLKLLHELFAKPLHEKGSCISRKEHAALFGSLSSITKQHSSLAKHMRRRMGEFPRKGTFADLFSSLKSSFYELHAEYDRLCDAGSRNDDDAAAAAADSGSETIDTGDALMTRSDVLDSCMQRLDFVGFLQSAYSDERCENDLLSMLNAPAHRLQYYAEQCRLLLDLTGRAHSDNAVLRKLVPMMDAAAARTRVAQPPPARTPRKALSKLQRRLNGFDVMSVRDRALLGEATLHWRDTELPSLLPNPAFDHSKRAKVGTFHFLLFSDVLVRVRKIDDENLKFKAHYELSKLTMECSEPQSGDAVDYTAVRWPLLLSDAHRQYTLGFETCAARHEWSELLASCGVKRISLVPVLNVPAILSPRSMLADADNNDNNNNNNNNNNNSSSNNNNNNNGDDASQSRTDDDNDNDKRDAAAATAAAAAMPAMNLAIVPEGALSRNSCPYPRLPLEQLRELAQAADSGSCVSGYGADGLILRRNPLYGIELPWAKVKLPQTNRIIADSFLLSRESLAKRKKARAQSGDQSPRNSPRRRDASAASTAAAAPSPSSSTKKGDAAYLEFVKGEIANDMASEQKSVTLLASKRSIMRDVMHGYDARVVPSTDQANVMARAGYARSIAALLEQLCSVKPPEKVDAARCRQLLEDLKRGKALKDKSEPRDMAKIESMLASPRTRSQKTAVSAESTMAVRDSILGDVLEASRGLPLRKTPIRQRAETWDSVLGGSAADKAVDLASGDTQAKGAQSAILDQWEEEFLTPRSHSTHRHRHTIASARSPRSSKSPRTRKTPRARSPRARSPRSTRSPRARSPRARSPRSTRSPRARSPRARSKSPRRSARDRGKERLSVPHSLHRNNKNEVPLLAVLTKSSGVPMIVPWHRAASNFLKHEEDMSKLTQFNDARAEILRKKEQLLEAM